MIMFFINEVFANDMVNSAEAPAFQSFTASIVPLLIFVAIFYFLLIRPQQKREKEHQKEVAGLKPNDKILTAGGIYGVIKKVKEKTLIVEIAKDVEIEIISETATLAKDLENSNSSKEVSLKKVSSPRKKKTEKSK